MSVVAVLFVLSGVGTVGRTAPAGATTALTRFAEPPPPGDLGVNPDPASGIVTNAADDYRTGWYGNQPNLTPAAVTAGDFGQLFSTQLNGGIGAQPLLADGTLLVVTQSDWAYGLNPQSGVIQWSDQFGTPWNPNDIGCTDVTSGARSTPVIDAGAGIAYFTMKSYISGDSGPAQWQLFAVSMSSGALQPGFPVTIQGTAQDDPQMTFDATDQLQRPGLLLMDGVVYMAFGSNCDRGTYQGWVFGVSTVTASITAAWVDCDEPAGTSCAGIWQSGGGLASDGDGNILLITGNNESPTPPLAGSPPPANLGESVVRLVVQPNGTLQPVDFFAPYDAAELDEYDVDFGSGGPMLLPSPYFGTSSVPNLMVAVGKEGYMYLLNRDDLGGMGEGPDGSDNVVQRIGPNGGVWSRPSAWPGDGGWVWINTGGSTDPGAYGYLQAYQYGVTSTGMPSLTLAAQSQDGFGYGDGSPMITSDGTASGSGVVWMIWSANETGADAQLRAYDATPTGPTPTLLWSTPINTSSARFEPVGIGDGIVYVGTRTGELLAYGAPVNEPLGAPQVQFPPCVVGTTATATETLTANTPLTVTSFAPEGSGFAVTGESTPLPATLSAGQSMAVDLSFTPGGVGPVAGSMGIDTSAGNVTVALSGQGVSPDPVLQATTQVLSFGGTTPDQAVNESVAFTNEGGATLTFDVSTPPGAPFSVTGLPADGSTLAPNQSVTVELTFDPTQPGDYSDQLVVDSNGGDIAVGLTGEAYVPSELVISPTVVTFPDTAPGATSTATFTVTDQGGSPLEITKSQPPSSGIISPLSELPEASVIGAGQSETIAVQFAPTAPGVYTDNWIINADDGVGLQTVTFVGYAEPTENPPGSLDPEYASSGAEVTPEGALNQASAIGLSIDGAGNALVAGTAYTGHNSSNLPVNYAAVTRLTPSGSLDPSFGNGAGDVLDDFGGGGDAVADGAAPGPNGSVLLWGTALGEDGRTRLLTAALEPDGAALTSWGAGGAEQASLGSPNVEGVAGAVGPTGDLFAACGTGASPATWVVSRYSGTTGQLVTTWGPSSPGRATLTPPGAPGASEPTALVASPDGSVYVVGNETGAADDVVVAHLTALGTLDTTYGTGGWQTLSLPGQDLTASSATLDAAGNLVVAGTASPVGGGPSSMAVVRLLPGGQVDDSFGGGVVTVPVASGASAAGVVVTPARVVVAGSATTASGQTEAALVALTPSGQLDDSFNGDGIRTDSFGGAGADSSADAVAVSGGDRLVVAGTTNSGTPGTSQIVTAQYELQGTLTSLTVSPSSVSVAAGLTQQMTAIGTYSDGTTENVTGNAVWSTGNPATDTVSSPQGLLTGEAVGTDQVTATFDGMSASVPVAVTAPVLQRVVVSPADSTVGIGQSEQFDATAVYSDGSRDDVTDQSAWSMASATDASVAAGGLVTGEQIGTDTVEATYDGATGTQGFSITPALESIAVTPANATVYTGGQQQFTATATFSDGSTMDLTSQAVWTSSNAAAASVSSLAPQSSGDVSGGLVTGLAVGTSTVTATVSGISGSATVQVQPAPPAVTAVTPDQGTVVGGTAVTLTGTALTGVTQVLFGSTPATSFTYVSPTEITAVSPPGSTGIVSVVVTADTGTSTATTQSDFTYVLPPVPAVTGVAPDVGPSAGGTVVTITGTNLAGVTQVLLGNTPAASFTEVSPTEVTAVTPARVDGVANVHVVTPAGTSPAQSLDQFTYLTGPAVTAVSPSGGPDEGGTTVTVTGTAFTGATEVLFGNTPAASFTDVSPTEVMAVSPPRTAGVANVHVVTPAGTSPAQSLDQFTYQPSASPHRRWRAVRRVTGRHVPPAVAWRHPAR